MIDNLKAQGVELPDVGERKPRLGTRVRTTKSKKEQVAGMYCVIFKIHIIDINYFIEYKIKTLNRYRINETPKIYTTSFDLLGSSSGKNFKNKRFV